MLSHAPSSASSPSGTDWYSLTLDDCYHSVSSSFDSCSAHSARLPSAVSGLAARRRQPKLASGGLLAPLAPLLYPRTPFCSPNSSPRPLDASPLLSSPLSAAVSFAPSGVSVGCGAAGPSRKQPPGSTAHPTVHTASASSTSSSAQSPHSARSHSVPFLPFRYFDEAECELPPSPDSALSFPHHCTPFPSPDLRSHHPAADVVPPSPLLLTRPNLPRTSPSSLHSTIGPAHTHSPHADFASFLLVPPSLLSNQPPLSPAVVPLTPPSSPLPLALSSSSPASASALVSLSVSAAPTAFSASASASHSIVWLLSVPLQS